MPHLFLIIGAHNTALLINDGYLDIAIDAIKPPIECAIRNTGRWWLCECCEDDNDDDVLDMLVTK